MNHQSLENFGAWQKASELFDHVVKDMEMLTDNPLCTRLISQQVAAADSVCANIEEGYGRGSTKEYVRFLVISRGTAHETRGRYHRFRRWLPPRLIEERVGLCNQIIGILTSPIGTLRTSFD